MILNRTNSIFNLNKPEPLKADKTSATPEANDKWESQQTIDFSLDDLPDSDTFSNDIIDFSFDLEPTHINSEKRRPKPWFWCIRFD